MPAEASSTTFRRGSTANTRAASSASCGLGEARDLVERKLEITRHPHSPFGRRSRTNRTCTGTARGASRKPARANLVHRRQESDLGVRQDLIKTIAIGQRDEPTGIPERDGTLPRLRTTNARACRPAAWSRTSSRSATAAFVSWWVVVRTCSRSHAGAVLEQVDSVGHACQPNLPRAFGPLHLEFSLETMLQQALDEPSASDSASTRNTISARPFGCCGTEQTISFECRFALRQAPPEVESRRA